MSRSLDLAKSIAEISRRSLPQPNGPRKNSTVGLPVAEILRQRCSAGHIGLAAGGLLDGAVRAHERRRENLQLALARIAPADPQLLSARRRIDIEPGAGRELRHRIDVRHVDPVRAEIEGHAENARIGDAAAADAVGRLDRSRPGGRRRRSGGRRRSRPRRRRRWRCRLRPRRRSPASRGARHRARGGGKRSAAARDRFMVSERLPARRMSAEKSLPRQID